MKRKGVQQDKNDVPKQEIAVIQKQQKQKQKVEEPPVPLIDDEESDDSDNEQIKVKIGKIPWKWYDNYKHFGYDENLKKIEKPPEQDKVDEFIKKAENPNWWREIRDELNQRNIVLTDEQLQLVNRIRQGKFASQKIAQADYQVEYEYNDPFPLYGGSIKKQSFMSSKYERIKINKIVQGILQGKIKVENFDPDQEEEESEEDEMFDIWENKKEDPLAKKMPPAITAPKMQLPGHGESYNPPEEYLFTKKELKQWQMSEPEDRPTNYVPKKYSHMRHLEFYGGLINERFDRCLNLYLCPRAKKKKLDIDPEILIPKLPKPEDLRPFPTTLNIQYLGHKSRIRSLDVLYNGQFMASCDERGGVIVWDVLTSRIQWRTQLKGTCYYIKFNANGLLAVACDTDVYIYNLKLALPSRQYQTNEDTLKESKQKNDVEYNNLYKWEFQTEGEAYDNGLRIIIKLNYAVKYINFHIKGDYLATVSPMAEKKNEEVTVHSISKGLSSRPFSKTKGNVEKVMFHPTKPFIFILTKKHTYVFNLQKQATVKKLMSGANWNSCIDIHPYGDNIIVGSFDKKVLWFDLDLQNTPYKTLKYHEKGVRQVVFHRKYPLMASCSDDGSINVMHAKVFSDLMENALIVPVKVLKGHEIKNDLGVLDIVFHPTQPWIFSCGADHRIILWT